MRGAGCPPYTRGRTRHAGSPAVRVRAARPRRHHAGAPSRDTAAPFAKAGDRPECRTSSARGCCWAIANVMPWALAWLCRGRGAAPLDLGLRLPDGARLLGDHKTWRGLAGSVVACALVVFAGRLQRPSRWGPLRARVARVSRPGHSPVVRHAESPGKSVDPGHA
jgi:CDP-archaeol synthase